MDPTVFTDTENEISCELDKAIQENKTVTRRRSTLNIDLEDWLVHDKSEAIEAYEKRLKQELKQWNALWCAEFQKRRHAKEKTFSFNCSPESITECTLLPLHMREYLAKAPNMDKFLADSVQFRQEAHLYLAVKHEERLLLQRNVVETGYFFQNRVTRNAVAELLEK